VVAWITTAHLPRKVHFQQYLEVCQLALRDQYLLIETYAADQTVNDRHPGLNQDRMSIPVA
jgi:hypothetical protein